MVRSSAAAPRGASPPRQPPPARAASPKAVAVYLTRLRPALVEATGTRREFVREIGLLMESARHQNPGAVAQGAGRLGRSQVRLFRDAQARVAALAPPPTCQVCQHAVLTWLDKQIAACEVMIEVSLKGDLQGLREVQAVLAEGRFHARKFNAEYQRLVGELRAVMAEVSGRKGAAAQAGERSRGRPLARPAIRPTARAR